MSNFCIGYNNFLYSQYSAPCKTCNMEGKNIKHMAKPSLCRLCETLYWIHYSKFVLGTNTTMHMQHVYTKDALHM